MPPRILLALPAHEADPLEPRLAEAGVEVVRAPDRVPERIAGGGIDACVVDTALVDLDAVLGAAERSPEDPAVIAVSGFGSVADAVGAIQRGAFDFLSGPVSPEQLSMAVGRALDQRELSAENRRLREDLEERRSLGHVTTRDEALGQILDTARSVADTRATVLLSGESGTGKTLLARAIHAASDRALAPFVETNCGAIPESLLESELFGHAKGAFTGAVRDKVGRFEAADGGTLFLDEVGVAKPALQIKLLRVLQDRVFERIGETRTREVDVRVIAATNVDLLAEVHAGRFREDLYWRLHVVPLELPALRERSGDIPLLARTFLKRANEEYGRNVESISPAAMAALCAHAWPGNVRQLEHAIERAVLLSTGSTIDVDDLGLPASETREPPELADGDRPILSLKQALEGPEKRIIEHALAVNDGNRKRTAEMLGVNRTTLFNKMRKYGLLDRRNRAS